MRLKIPPPIWLTLYGIFVWGLSELIPSARIDIPVRGLISGCVFLSAFAFLAPATRGFKKAETTINPIKPQETSQLVTTGIYGRTRNPMYVGLTIILLAWVIWTSNATGVLALPLFMVTLTHFQIIPEEEILTEKFGEDYKDYSARVRRWL